MIKCFYLIFILFIVAVIQSCAYKTSFAPSTPSNVVIKNKSRTFHMNRFVRHAVIYEGTGKNGDLFRFVVCDSLRFQNDTLFTLWGPEEYKTEIDSFIHSDEQTVIINKMVWQPISTSKLYRIKSKRQPLSRITAIICTASYAAFLTGLIVAATSKDESTSTKWGAIALIGDVTFLATLPINTSIAKKHFVFKKYKFRQRHRPMVIL